MVSQPALAQSVTGPPTNLTPGSYSPDYFSRVSINGTRISYTPDKGDFDLSYTYKNIGVMSGDGSGNTILNITAYRSGSEEFGSVSADGSKIVVRQSGYDGYNGLYIATVSPFKQTLITNAATNPDDSYPTFSADGTKVAFVSTRNGDGVQVYVMKAALEDSLNNVPAEITNFSDGSATQLAGTADGKLLLVKVISASVQEIFKVNLDGTGLKQITNFGGALGHPSQPVVGGPIYFIKTGKDNRTHVFSIKEDGSGLHQVTGGEYTEDYASAATDKLVVTLTDPVYGAGNSDIYSYALSSATAKGTVTGTLTTSTGAVAAGSTVNAYDGDTLAGTTTTNGSGVYTLSLPPGGYTLQYVTATPNSWTVSRSVTVASEATTTRDAFTTPVSAPRPSGLIATVKGTNAVLRWTAAAAPGDGFSLVGYNVYRAASEVGPWTKITATPIAPVAPLQYSDTPSNLATAFYKMTSQTSDGSTTRESAFTDVAQAANNIVYNPSFEISDTNGYPDGWAQGSWGGDGSTGSTTDAKVDGSKAAFILTGATARGAMMLNTDPLHCVPVQPGIPVVEGLFGKFKDTSTTWPLSLQTANNVPGYTYWYPGGGGLGGAWDTAGLTNAGGDTDWVWLANTGNVLPFEFSSTTRLSVFWANDGATNFGSSTAYADEATYQVKRYGATGMVFGRIVDDQGNGMAGITVKVGNVSIITNGAATFTIPNAPTGPQTLTISVPHKADYSIQIGNYGGYNMGAAYVVTNPGVFTIDGHVLYPDGKPCPGADVRLVLTSGDAASAAEVSEVATTTDANGYYTLGDSLYPVTSQYVSHLVAHKNGYVSPRLDKNFGSAGWSINNNVNLIQPSTTFQIAKTSSAPTIDGHINASEWAASQKIPMPFMDDKGFHGAAPFLATSGYALWDNDNVYFAFSCDEPNPAGIIDDTTIDPTTTLPWVLWGGPPYWNGHDIIEMRVDPTNGGSAGSGYEWWQLMTNTGTVNYDVINRAVASNLWGKVDLSGLGMQVASYVDTAGKKWTQEIKIPFSALSYSAMTVGTPTVGSEWAINLGRSRHQPDPQGSYFATSPFITHLGSIARFVNTLTPVTKGDLNGDGVVNNVDAVLSLQIAAGLAFVDGRMAQADVNADGSANVSDTVKIIRKINGKDSSF
jgi:hypothetical protein